MTSKIEWTDETWNPVTGCTKVSQGCKNCYAERWWPRVYPGRKFTDVQCHPDRLDQPLRWKKPRRVFVNSMSDLFHEDIPDNFIAEVISIIGRCPQHTFQILTKRIVRAKEILKKLEHWPLPNLWLGVSVEDMASAAERIPVLLETPAAIRWLSCEPLLGPIFLNQIPIPCPNDAAHCCGRQAFTDVLNCVDWCDAPECSEAWVGPGVRWVVVGGESGPEARPMRIEWARTIRDDCIDSGIPFFFKQWGEWISKKQNAEPSTVHRRGKKKAGRELDGRTWDEYPA